VVESIQAAVDLYNVLKVYRFSTYRSRKFLENLRKPFRRFGSDEVEKMEED